MQYAQTIEKRKYRNLVCNEYSWGAWPMRILNICTFACTSENGALILYFKKYNFENLKKLQNIVNIFLFFIKISCQSKEFPLSKQSPFTSTPPFPENYFIPTFNHKLQDIIHSFLKRGGGGFWLCIKNNFWSYKNWKQNQKNL